ncbi:MAG: type I restriction endonuclease EcoAI [Acidobacteriota bacterium]
MTPERLLAHYDRIADSPDAVLRLRSLVLDLAVRGKLVPQDSREESAPSLLGRIRSEKRRKGSLRGGGRNQQEASTPESPFPLPSGWTWSCIADLGFISPRNDAPDSLPASFVAMSMISSEYGLPNRHEIRRWGEIKRGYTHFADGDVALAKITPCFENGKSTVLRGLAGGIGSGTTELHVVRPVFVNAYYILIFLKCRHFIDMGIPRMTGTAGQKRVPADYFATSPFPLPPLAEQQRIVAKVNELMVLCDQLEAARGEREAARDRLTTATLARLNDPDPVTFPSDARFALDAIPALTTRSNQIHGFRQSILDLAVRGRLVPPLKSELPAQDFLRRIEAAKIRRATETRDRRIRASTNPSAGELSIDLPSHWSVQSFENLFLFIDYRGRTPTKVTRGVPLITAKNIRMGHLNREPREFIAESTYKSWMTRGVPKIGDLFFTTEAPLANVCANGISEPFALAQRVICLQPFDRINSRYFMLAMMSEVVQSMISRHATGMTAKGIKAAKLKPLPLPIPPEEEQDRIVAKVDELMALCDQLEASLAKGDEARRRLLDALLHEALEAGRSEAA